MARFFIPAFSVKILAGLGLGALYVFYYKGGDTQGYFYNASVFTDLFWSDPSAFFLAIFRNEMSAELAAQLTFQNQPRAIFMSQIVSILQLFIGSNFWVTTIYLSSISFFAMFYFANQLNRYLKNVQWPAAIAFLFYPSVVFWSSGLLKESVVMTCFGFGLGSLAPLLLTKEKLGLVKWSIVIACFFILFKLKYYYALVMIPILLSYLLVNALEIKIVWKRNICWLACLIIFCALGSLLHPNLSAERFSMVIVDNYYVLIEKSKVGQYLVFAGLEKNVLSILSHFPKALMAGLFSPLFNFSSSNLLLTLVSLENCVLLVLVFFSFPQVRLIRKSKYQLLILSMLLYVFVEAVLLSISTPVFGTLVRYKVGYLPFFVFVVLLQNPLISFLKKA